MYMNSKIPVKLILNLRYQKRKKEESGNLGGVNFFKKITELATV